MAGSPSVSSLNRSVSFLEESPQRRGQEARHALADMSPLSFGTSASRRLSMSTGHVRASPARSVHSAGSPSPEAALSESQLSGLARQVASAKATLRDSERSTARLALSLSPFAASSTSADLCSPADKARRTSSASATRTLYPEVDSRPSHSPFKARSDGHEAWTKDAPLELRLECGNLAFALEQERAEVRRVAALEQAARDRHLAAEEQIAELRSQKRRPAKQTSVARHEPLAKPLIICTVSFSHASTCLLVSTSTSVL